MSAPADTLTQVTTALQQNVGTLGKSITDITKSIGDIGTQATKIETLGKKYEETEALTRRMYSIMIGSYEKGRSGENYLRNMMNELMKIGLVRENVRIGTKLVEYCVVFGDGKLLAIDSKVVATKDVESLFDEETSDEDRDTLKKKIRNALGKKVEEVCQYIDPQTTLPCAVMAIPDSLVDLSSDIVPEAVRMNVMIAGYSAVPQLIVYFIRIHGFYAIEEDVATLKDRLMAIQQEVSRLDDDFFANRLERPVKMLTNASLQMRQIVSRISGIITLEHEALSVSPEET
jgi:DNA anti-recombination protein RmuC